MWTEQELKAACRHFGIAAVEIGPVIDSSRGEQDRRYAYKINGTYMLKLANAPAVHETFLQSIVQLISRYHHIGVYCPQLIADAEGHYAHAVQHEGSPYTAYIEEFAKYPAADPDKQDGWALKLEMLPHMGRLAAQYTGIGLVETRSMWSLFELSPWDTYVDEKQENLNDLTGFLREQGFDALADRLIKANEDARGVLLPVYDRLPRCVYQGDLNLTNLLVDDEGHFKGLIDFNMFGTEVNLNCFLNECTWIAEPEEYGLYSAHELLNRMCAAQDRLMAGILSCYTLNELEIQCLPALRKIILLSIYPNTVLWKRLLKEENYADTVCRLLEEIADMPL